MFPTEHFLESSDRLCCWPAFHQHLIAFKGIYSKVEQYSVMDSSSFKVAGIEMDPEWSELSLDDLLGFDCDVYHENIDTPVDSDLTSEEGMICKRVEYSFSVPKKQPARSVRRAKLPRKNAAVKKVKKEPTVDSASVMTTFLLPEVDSITSNLVTAPNMSRRVRDLTLYAFPKFNKCDSLLYFPSTMAQHLNSGDFSSLSELLSAHLHKNCSVQLVSGRNVSLTPPMFVGLFELCNELYPDSIMCMHSTKVVDNEIRSNLHFKFTDNKIIYESFVRKISGTDYASLFSKQRSEHIVQCFKANLIVEKDLQTICMLMDTEPEVVVYGRVELRLLFDETTKRVMDVKFISTLTSVTCSTET